MNNFTFQNPTKLIFGRGEIASLRSQIPAGSKILMTMGGGSIKTNGVYDQVKAALTDFDVVEFWGIEPNPRVETLRKAIALGISEKIDFILAVGGGSVIDGTKLISVSIANPELEPWDIVIGKSPFSTHTSFGSVLTLPATGSEMNRAAVISNDATGEKFAFYSYYPDFSVLDPEATFTLPKHQIACGLADTFVHVMEQYMTCCQISPLMDRWSEGILQTVVEIAPKVLADSTDYDQMSNFMLCATMALNGFVAMGVPQDWATHMVGHELTALTGLTHGHTLSIIQPAMLSVMREQKGAKLLQFGERVWGIKDGSDDERIDATIAATEAFYRSLGLKTRLSENGVGDDITKEIIRRFRERGSRLGEGANVTYVEIEQVLRICR